MLKALSLFALTLFAIPAFAAVNLDASGLISGLIYIIVVAMVFWLLWWLISYVGLPEPFNKVARVVLAVVAVLFLINLLLGIAGTPLVNLR